MAFSKSLAMSQPFSRLISSLNVGIRAFTKALCTRRRTLLLKAKNTSCLHLVMADQKEEEDVRTVHSEPTETVMLFLKGKEKGDKVSSAREQLEGDSKAQFARLWDYGATLQKHNPGTCFKVKTIRPSPDLAPVFKRVYVRFEAYKTGFLEGCRPFIGLDGCHLKGLYGGHLLSVVARDGNDNMFPVVVAVVEAETRDSWSWFLTELIDDLGGSESLVFISDRQKGLVESFMDLLPTTEHRFCMRHLYANFKKKRSGKKVKDYLWNAVKAGTVNDFNYWIGKIRNLDKDGEIMNSQIFGEILVRSLLDLVGGTVVMVVVLL
ncbi:hypothetical protein RJ639_010723 [Escallonia herrerae]|uniref:MULE transposase domain-containing protein n=1 Tax=Escallonia herrerae TaxID=1293975 RepID=A0AA89AMU1_9ASTE|nr:hypothetical protein RJ639_010723 [Escallonia herrerae]